MYSILTMLFQIFIYTKYIMGSNDAHVHLVDYIDDPTAMVDL